MFERRNNDAKSIGKFPGKGAVGIPAYFQQPEEVFEPFAGKGKPFTVPVDQIIKQGKILLKIRKRSEGEEEGGGASQRIKATQTERWIAALFAKPALFHPPPSTLVLFLLNPIPILKIGLFELPLPGLR